MKQQKQLEAGKTKIARLFLDDQESNQTIECDLYYGNVIDPVINGKVMHIKDWDEYKRILAAFFNEEQVDDDLIIIEDGGSQYEIPSEWDLIRSGFEMTNKERAIQGALEKEMLDEDEEGEHDKRTVEHVYSADDDTIAKINEAIDRIPGNDRKLRRMRVFTIMMTILSLAAIAAAGWIYYQSTLVVPVDKTYIKINGVTYEVPLANVTVEEGREKILIYGFSVTNKDGEISYDALPLGEYDLDSTYLENAAKNKEDQADQEPEEGQEDSGNGSEEEGNE